MVKVNADKYYQIERQIEREIAGESTEEVEGEMKGRTKKTIEFEDKMEGCQMVLLKTDKYPLMDGQIDGQIDIGNGAENERTQKEEEKMRVIRGLREKGYSKKKRGVTGGRSKQGSLQTN